MAGFRCAFRTSVCHTRGPRFASLLLGASLLRPGTCGCLVGLTQSVAVFIVKQQEIPVLASYNPEQPNAPPDSLEALSDEQLVLLRQRCSTELGRRSMAHTHVGVSAGHGLWARASSAFLSEKFGYQDGDGDADDDVVVEGPSPEEVRHRDVTSKDLGMGRFVPGTTAWRRNRVLRDFPQLGFRASTDIDRFSYHSYRLMQAFYGERGRKLDMKFYYQDIDH